MKTVEIITTEGQQSIRLPKDCRIEASEVFVKRLGRSLLLIPKDSDIWEVALMGLDEFTEDFMQVREQPAEQFRNRTLIEENE